MNRDIKLLWNNGCHCQHNWNWFLCTVAGIFPSIFDTHSWSLLHLCHLLESFCYWREGFLNTEFYTQLYHPVAQLKKMNYSIQKCFILQCRLFLTCLEGSDIGLYSHTCGGVYVYIYIWSIWYNILYVLCASSKRRRRRRFGSIDYMTIFLNKPVLSTCKMWPNVNKVQKYIIYDTCYLEATTFLVLVTLCLFYMITSLSLFI